jgi:hypothetical protein
VPDAGALLGVPVDRAQQGIDVDERPGLDAAQQPGPLDKVDQVRPRDRRQLQAVAVDELPQELAQRRRRVHSPNTRGIPPERIASRSSMLSAPGAIPAMIEVTFPARFTPADFTVVAVTATLFEISSDRPACSASAITGTNPAYDTRFSSSNSGCARDQPSGTFTVGAFLDRLNQDVDTPDSLDPEGTFSINAPNDHLTGPRIEA